MLTATWAALPSGPAIMRLRRVSMPQLLPLNPRSIMVLTNIGLTKLASGDSVGAQADYDRAIAAAPAYLNGVDGQPLQGQDRQTALTQARQELTAAAAALQAVAKQMPALQPAADKLVQQLQGDAARLS